MSPFKKKNVHAWFSKIPYLGLAAEDGYLYRFNSVLKKNYEW